MRLGVEETARHEVTEDSDAVNGRHREAGRLEQGDELGLGEPAGEHVGVGEAARRIVDDTTGLVEAAGDGARDGRRRPARREDTRDAAGTEHMGKGVDRRRRVVDDLEHAVAQDEVDGGLAADLAETCCVTLHSADGVGDPRLGRSAFECGE